MCVKEGGIGTENVSLSHAQRVLGLVGSALVNTLPPSPHFHLLSTHVEGRFLWKPVTLAFAAFHLERHHAAAKGWKGEALGPDVS